MGKKVIFSIELGVISTLFQYIIFDVYGNLLTNQTNLEMIMENFDIKKSFGTSETTWVFIIVGVFFYITTIFLIKIKSNLNAWIYWIIASFLIFFWIYVSIYSIVFSIYKLETLVFFLVPIGYFAGFYINFKKINKELKKKNEY